MLVVGDSEGLCDFPGVTQPQGPGKGGPWSCLAGGLYWACPRVCCGGGGMNPHTCIPSFSGLIPEESPESSFLLEGDILRPVSVSAGTHTHTQV